MQLLFFYRESTSVHAGTQIREHEETVQVSPSTVHKTTIYEAQRTIGAGQPVLSATSTGFRTISPVHSSQIQTDVKEDAAAEQHVEEKYEVTLSTYDQSGSKLLSTAMMTTTSAASTSDEGSVRILFAPRISATIDLSRFELDEEMYIACAIVNESLYDKNADKKKMVRLSLLTQNALHLDII